MEHICTSLLHPLLLTVPRNQQVSMVLCFISCEIVRCLLDDALAHSIPNLPSIRVPGRDVAFCPRGSGMQTRSKGQ